MKDKFVEKGNKKIKSIIDDKWLLTFIINLNLSSVWIFFQC